MPPWSVPSNEVDRKMSSGHFVRMYRSCKWRQTRLYEHAVGRSSRKFVGHDHHAVIECCANRRNPGEAMSHDGNFDRLDVDQEFCEKWQRRRASESGGLRNAQASAGPGGVGNAVCKGFVDSADVIPVH